NFHAIAPNKMLHRYQSSSPQKRNIKITNLTMFKKLLLLFLFLWGPFSNAHSFDDLAGPDSNGIIYVNKNVVGGTQSGNSWANAYKELADALKWADQNKALFSAVNPLQIWVAAGTYNPKYSPQDGTNRFTNKTRDNTFLLVDNVKVYG